MNAEIQISTESPTLQTLSDIRLEDLGDITAEELNEVMLDAIAKAVPRNDSVSVELTVVPSGTCNVTPATTWQKPSDAELPDFWKNL